MNKSAFFIVLLVTIALSSCSRIASYDGLMSRLVQLNTAAGKESSQIAILISQVRASYNEANDKFSQFISAVEGRCAAGNTAHSTFVKRLEDEILSLQASSQQATESNTSVQTQIELNNARLATSNSNLEKTKNEIAQAVESYNTYSVEAEGKLVVIKTLRDIINDELYNHSQGKTSFIQLKTFTSKVKELQSLLNEKNDILISPLVSTLLSLAQNQKFTDQTTLQKILEILGTLENSLKKFRSEQETNERRNIVTLKGLARTSVEEIQNLSQIDRSLQSQIVENNAIVARAQQEIQEIQNERKRKDAEYAYFGKICDYQQSIKENNANFNTKFSSEADSFENQVTNLQ